MGLWGTAGFGLRRGLPASAACARKEERLKINDLSFHFQKLEKEQIEAKDGRRKEVRKEEMKEKDRLVVTFICELGEAGSKAGSARGGL